LYQKNYTISCKARKGHVRQWKGNEYHTVPYHTISNAYNTIPLPMNTIQGNGKGIHIIPYHTMQGSGKAMHTIPYHNIPYHRNTKDRWKKREMVEKNHKIVTNERSFPSIS